MQGTECPISYPPLPDSYLEKKRKDNWMTRTYAIKLPYKTRILQEILKSHMYLCDVRLNATTQAPPHTVTDQEPEDGIVD